MPAESTTHGAPLHIANIELLGLPRPTDIAQKSIHSSAIEGGKRSSVLGKNRSLPRRTSALTAPLRFDCAMLTQLELTTLDRDMYSVALLASACPLISFMG